MNYSPDELMILLESVEAVVPISSPNWDLVANHHSLYFPDTEQMGEQLKKKFYKIADSMIPTGDPNCRDHVQGSK